MLAIARETRLSETTFVQTATEAGADYRNRIFTLHGELPFAGHPSLGTAVAVARARGEARRATSSRRRRACSRSTSTLDGVAARASMLQNPAVFGPELDPGARPRSRRAGPGRRRIAAWPPQLVSTGVPHVVTPVRDVAALARARADETLLPALLDDAGRDLRLRRRRRLAGRRREGAELLHGRHRDARGPGDRLRRRPAARVRRRSAPACSELTVGQGAEIGRAQHACTPRSRATASGSPATSWSSPRARPCSRTSVQRTPIRLSPGEGLPITVIGQAAPPPLGIGGGASSGLGGPAPPAICRLATDRTEDAVFGDLGALGTAGGALSRRRGLSEERRRRRARGERVERRAGLRRQPFEAQRVHVALLLAHHARPAADAAPSRSGSRSPAPRRPSAGACSPRASRPGRGRSSGP